MNLEAPQLIRFRAQGPTVHVGGTLTPFHLLKERTPSETLTIIFIIPEAASKNTLQ